MTDEKPADNPLTVTMVRDIVDRLKAIDDAQRTGTGVLMATPEGFKWLPVEDVMLWHG
jgi:hypothetical protein